MIITADVVVTGAEVCRPGWVEVEGGRVVAIGAGMPERPADLALGDRMIVPGFVDMHVHGGGGGSFSEATPDAIGAAIALHRQHGTTSLLASLVSARPAALRAQVERLANQVDGSGLLGIHLEGPWLAPRRRGAHEPKALRDPDPAEVGALLAAGRGTIRMVTIAPELPGAIDAIRQIVDAGAVAAIGHTDATYEQARAGIEAGATVATHLFNAMRPVHHREPGPVVAVQEDPRVTLEMITDGVHLHPALYRAVTTRVGPDRVSLVTDAMAAAGMPDGAYHLGSLEVEVADGAARLAGTTTIAGGTATMAQVFAFAVRHAGTQVDAALLTAAKQACLNPRRALGLSAPGLAPGAPADLVVLDPALAVVGVLKSGHWDLDPARAVPA